MSVIDVPTLEQMARQYGVISIRQLSEELGWSASAIGRARRSGTLRTVAPGVVQTISDRETFESRCMAAVLATNGAGFLSGWSVARLHGLRKMPESPIHVTVPHHFRLVSCSTIDLHRSKWYDRQEDFVTRPDGLRIATPMRMLFGIAAAFNQFRFERAAEDAWHLGLRKRSANIRFVSRPARRFTSTLLGLTFASPWNREHRGGTAVTSANEIRIDTGPLARLAG